MSGIDLGASDLLGKRAARAVSGIEDPRVREHVVRALLVCDEALEVVDSLDLTPHELATEDVPSLATWNALAPDTRNLLLSVRKAAEQLLGLFPPPVEQAGPDTSSVDFDLDLAFEEMEAGKRPEPIRDRRDREIDELVGGVDATQTFEQIGQAIAALASMLQSDFVNFGGRLQNPAVVGDRWFLLSELQELRQKCSQCLEAIVAVMLKAVAGEDLELVMPRYQTAAHRAQRLRTALVDLEKDVELLNEQAQRGGVGDLAAIRQALILRLNEFGEHGAYADVRPLDKQQLIQFRRLLAANPSGPKTLMPLRRGIEGFAKFLEVMHAINDREVLSKSDRTLLQTIRMLLESEEGVEEVEGMLGAVYGRSPSLDVHIRTLRDGQRPPTDDLLAAVVEAQSGLPAAGGGW